MVSIFGVLSAVLNFAAYAPYVRDILRKKTKPQRITWLIFSVLGGVSFSSQLALGARGSLWLAGAQTLSVLLVFTLSLPYGVGGFKRLDLVSLAGAIVGLACWAIFRQAAYALYGGIVVGSIGLVPTVHKAIKWPETETTATWVLGAVAGFSALFAAGLTAPFNVVIYPVFVILNNGVVAVPLLLSKPGIGRGKVLRLGVRRASTSESVQ